MLCYIYITKQDRAHAVNTYSVGAILLRATAAPYWNFPDTNLNHLMEIQYLILLYGRSK